ncbi:MAG: esterase-like activity of phytase family protein [Methylotenera sp.]
MLIVLKNFKHKNFKLGATVNILLGAAVIFLIFNSDLSAQAAESAQFNGLDLPATPNTNKHASVLATFVLPATDISTINPGVDLGDLSVAAKNGYPNAKIPGIGSALVAVPNKPNEFFMMTDRGPNYDNTNSSGKSFGKVFPLPKFTPAIVHVKLTGGKIEVIRAIPITDTQSSPVTGISNNKEDESPYLGDASSPMGFNPNGLDTEAMQLLPDGNFIIAEEYGPSIVVVDANGKVLVRYVPEGKNYAGIHYPVKAILPAIYKERRGNRGFENLSVTPDGKTAYVTLQSPMGDAKNKAYEKSRVVRILRLDITQPTDAKVTGMFLVMQTEKSAYPETDKQKDLKYSDAVALGQDRILLLERATKKVKLIVADLSNATNVLNYKEANSLIFESEGESLDKLAVKSADTHEVFDSRDVFFQIDTDKLEGLAVLTPGVVAISNDNDFGIGEDNRNEYPSKVWIVRLGKSLTE